MQFNMPASDVTVGAVFVADDGVGDANNDGEVNIIDVLMIINHILGRDPQPFVAENADYNGDEIIDIADVTGTNSIIIGAKSECGDEIANYDIIDGVLYFDAPVALSGFQFVLSEQPEVTSTMAGFSVAGNWVNGQYVMLVYNLNGEIEAGIYDVLNLNGATLSDVRLATQYGCVVTAAYGTLGINEFDESNYSAYPVPAQYDVTIEGPSINRIEVYNSVGQLVMLVDDVDSDRYVVDVTSFVPGNYIFRILAEGGMAVKNVVVVR